MKKLIVLFIAFLTISANLGAQDFTGNFDMVVSHNYPNNRQQVDTISYFFGVEKTAIIIYGKRKDPDMRMIFSPEDSTITSLFELNGRKGGYILPMDEKHWPSMSHAIRPYGSGPRKKLNYTGGVKVIENYQCKEVLAEVDEYSAILWLADNIKLSMSRVFSYQSVGAGESDEETNLFEKFGIVGLPLEMQLKSKKEKANVIIRLVNFKNTFDELIFSTEGFSLSKIDH